MKRFILKFAALGLFLSLVSTANAQACLNEARAIQNVRQDCPNAPQPNGGGHYEAYQVAIGTCIAGSDGCFSIWDVYFVSECPNNPHTNCFPVPPVLVGTVTENCDGSVTVACQ
jgi:hypothetical protein